MSFISQGEVEFIRNGVLLNCRSDGRQRLDLHSIELINQPISHCNSSLTLKHSQSETEIIFGLTCEIESVDINSPLEGLITCSVDCSQMSISDVTNTAKSLDAQSYQFSTIVEKLVKKHLDLTQLCIIPNEQCWHIYIGIVVLNSSSGSLIDLLSIGVYSVLNQLILPSIEVTTDLETNEQVIDIDEDKIGKQIICDDLPIIVTLNSISGQLVADSSIDESECSDSAISCSVLSNHAVVGIEKSGSGVLHTSLLKNIRSVASTVANQRFQCIMQYLQSSLFQQTNEIGR